MSMQGDQGQPAGTVDPTTNGNGLEPGQGDSSAPVAGSENSQPDPEHPFLANVPEEHKPILSEYIKKWDANVTRRMQETASRYRPYEELGDVESLAKARQLYDWFSTDPQGFVQAVQQRLNPGQQVPQQQPNFQQSQGLEGVPEDLAPLAQYFTQQLTPFQQQFEQYRQQTTNVLQAMANAMLEQRRTSQEAQEDAAFDAYLNNLRTEFGDFDETFVLMKMQAGATAEQAIKEWRDTLQNALNSMRAPSAGAAVLSGGGGTPPAQQRRVEDLTSQEVRKLTAEVLEQAAQQNR